MGTAEGEKWCGKGIAEWSGVWFFSRFQTNLRGMGGRFEGRGGEPKSTQILRGNANHRIVERCRFSVEAVPKMRFTADFPDLRGFSEPKIRVIS